MKLLKYTVDRFEGHVAILLLREDETVQIEVEKNKLPHNVKEGDILKRKSDKTNEFKILKEETDHAYERANELLQKILNKDR